MSNGYFYFLEDDYFNDFPDPKLMSNKEAVGGVPHDRPCYFAFQESDTNLYWVIPISSQVAKFTSIYNRKITKNGKCDTIVFGEVLGYRKAFLIQNMCPVSSKYIREQYLESRTSNPVQIDGRLEREIISKAKKILSLVRKGHKHLVFPDIMNIEQGLLGQIRQ